MIKYRSTAYPELLFVHDWLLTLACRRIRRTAEGKNLQTLEEKHEELKAKKRRTHDKGEDDATQLLGASKPVTDDEEAEVMPTYIFPADPLQSAETQLSGLPRLLHGNPDLDERGWPTFRHDAGESRVKWIYAELGLGGPFEEPQLEGEMPSIKIKLQKFTRAQLPIEECVSSVQCRAQWKKNNQWGLVIWTVDVQESATDDSSEPEAAAVTTTEVCAVQFQYYVLAEYTTVHGRKAQNGAGAAGGIPPDAEPLRLGVAKVFKLEALQVPGMRPEAEQDPAERDHELSLPEIMCLNDCRPIHNNPAYCGTWVLDLKAINSQLVATREVDGARLFMTSDRASGRHVAVKR